MDDNCVLESFHTIYLFNELCNSALVIFLQCKNVTHKKNSQATEVWGGGVHVESVNCQLLQYVISSYAILIKKPTIKRLYSLCSDSILSNSTHIRSTISISLIL